MKKTFALIFAFSLCYSVNAAPKTVIPSGQTVGISIITEGVLVVDTTEITDENGNTFSPAEKAGIKIGDRIISADGNKINSSEQLIDYVNLKKNDVVLTVKRSSESLNTVVSPVESGDGYKLGIWVRDSTAGLGTVTYIDPKTGAFGALGHGIADIDTNTLLTCRDGKLFDCQVLDPTPGKKGTPGELNANFKDMTVASFLKNTDCGLFGKVYNTQALSQKSAVEVADFNDITEGPATILSNVDGAGISEYSIEIKKASPGNLDGKNIVFKVTDENLISKTGGIVQGMSGSPILQNGKIVGAVTHVFVNDPTRGYGIFIENMLAEAKKN